MCHTAGWGWRRARRGRDRSGASPGRRAFTLVEMLVVISITALLMALMMPTLQSARATARIVKCASGMRQWGIALHGYLGEFANVMPDEGRSGLNHLDGTWYNELPPYANAAAYRDIYDGDNLGPSIGYADSWIWYCPERILVKKNSGSGKNSYHYAMNGVLNGHGTDEFGGVMNFLPDYGSDDGRFHTSADLVPAHSLTPF